MSDQTRHRVARRYLESANKTAVLAHVDRDGYRWGWLDGNVRRLHLVPLDDVFRGAARVWLEDRRGDRSFELDFALEPVEFDFDALRASVSRSRDTIEASWLRSCEAKGWLMYSPRDAMISLHSGTPYELVRRLKGAAFIPEFLQLDTQANTACLEVRLNRVIWTGCDDGSDAVPASMPRTQRSERAAQEGPTGLAGWGTAPSVNFARDGSLRQAQVALRTIDALKAAADR